MKIYRGYKTELRLNNRQRTLGLKACSVARFAYNWGLRIKIDEYRETGKSPNAIELHRRFNALKTTELNGFADHECWLQKMLIATSRQGIYRFQQKQLG